MFVDGRSRIAEEPSSVPKLALPEATEVKKPGRPAKIQRLSALPKDFASAKFRKAFNTEKVKEKEVIEEDEQKEEKKEENSKDYVYDLYILKKRRLIVKEEHETYQLNFLLSSDINNSDVVSTYNPKSNGYCGFRAAAFLIYGDEEQITKVKEAMVKVMTKQISEEGKYEDFYQSSLGMATYKVKKTITCGIDLLKKMSQQS